MPVVTFLKRLYPSFSLKTKGWTSQVFTACIRNINFTSLKRGCSLCGTLTQTSAFFARSGSPFQHLDEVPRRRMFLYDFDKALFDKYCNYTWVGISGDIMSSSCQFRWVCPNWAITASLKSYLTIIFNKFYVVVDAKCRKPEIRCRRRRRFLT